MTEIEKLLKEQNELLKRQNELLEETAASSARISWAADREAAAKRWDQDNPFFRLLSQNPYRR